MVYQDQQSRKRKRILRARPLHTEKLSTVDFVTLFSDEIVLHIFQYLNDLELVKSSLASHQWRRLAMDRQVRADFCCNILSFLAHQHCASI